MDNATARPLNESRLWRLGVWRVACGVGTR